MRPAMPCKTYLVVELPEPEVLPLELPEPMLPLELPEPVLPLEPVLGALGAAGAVLGDVVLLPDAPLPALEPDLLKCASHSEREIVPSLLVSTDEKLGAAVLVLPLALGVLLLDDDVPPDAAGEDEDGLLVLGLPELLDELCDRATPDNANRAAAVAALNSLRFNIGRISFERG